MKILAGIVTYNPDITRLRENIEAISGQVDEVAIFDNGSNNSFEIKELQNEYDISIIFSKQNTGIAFALNKLAEYSLNKNYEWLLTLDGDSVVYPNLVLNYKKYVELPNIGQLSCKRKDRNINANIETKNKGPKKVKYAITSASLIKLEALKECGGFDNQLFIDWVDNEICCALRKAGYETYEMDYIGLLQEMGHAKKVRFLNKTFYRPNYSPIRYYYNARNSVFVSRLYPNEESTLSIIFNQLKVIVLNFLYEKEKKEKFKAILNGLFDGMKLPVNRGRYLK